MALDPTIKAYALTLIEERWVQNSVARTGQNPVHFIIRLMSEPLKMDDRDAYLFVKHNVEKFTLAGLVGAINRVCTNRTVRNPIMVIKRIIEFDELSQYADAGRLLLRREYEATNERELEAARRLNAERSAAAKAWAEREGLA